MHDFETRLRARMREAAPDVPATVDAAVLAAGQEAARAFEARRRMRRIRTAAAAALVLVGLWLGVRSEGTPRALDVADAWRVATGREHDRRFDQNGDGRVDGADADAILTRITALPPRRKS